MIKVLTTIVSLASLVFCALGSAAAQNFPTRPVRIINDAAPGSTLDVYTRMIADRLGTIWGQQVVMVNQPGGGGLIAARAAAEAVADGYTLYMPSSAPTLWQSLQIPRDFVPIGFVAQLPLFFSLSPTVNAKTLPELIALAKQKPNEFSYATSGVGRLSHLAGELLQSRAGIQLQMIPYTTGGAAQTISDLISGRVSMLAEGYSSVASLVESGTIKLLAVASAQRISEFPDVPAVAETLPGFNAVGWNVMVAPPGTPDAIIQKVSADLRTVLGQPDLQKQLAARGAYVRVMSPTEVADFIRAEQQQWKPILDKITQQK